MDVQVGLCPLVPPAPSLRRLLGAHARVAAVMLGEVVRLGEELAALRVILDRLEREVAGAKLHLLALERRVARQLERRGEAVR